MTTTAEPTGFSTITNSSSPVNSYTIPVTLDFPTATATETATTITQDGSVYTVSCGKSNPTCENCYLNVEICIGDGCIAPEIDYLECPDGQDYYLISPVYEQLAGWKIALITLAALVVFWILAGLFQSWVSFRRVMVGETGSLGRPSLWGGSHVQYRAKTTREQRLLQKEWDQKHIGQRLSLWWKLAFKEQYPEMLGPVPPNSVRSVRRTTQRPRYGPTRQ
jgi:hypothetical protein